MWHFKTKYGCVLSTCVILLNYVYLPLPKGSTVFHNIYLLVQSNISANVPPCLVINSGWHKTLVLIKVKYSLMISG